MTTATQARPQTLPTRAPLNVEPGFGALFFPCLIAFFSGFCVMVVELVASRLVSRYIGASLYTWTTVIGVILAGISIGSYLGGWLADRIDTKRLIAFLFLLAGALTYAVLPVTDYLGVATQEWIYSERMWTLRMLVIIVGAFLLPGTAIGMISPVIAKWALDRGFATGGTVGAIYSWNTIGSILGTFATGFFLIWQFEVDRIIELASIGLAGAAVLFLPAIVMGLTKGRSEPAPGRVLRPVGGEGGGGLLLPCLLVFTSGFCIMMIEMVASRLVAVHIGQSLFTWTSVIGVVLAGISLGNRIGGRLADRFESKQLVGALFFISSILCISILTSHQIVGNATRAWMGREWNPLEWLGEDSATWATRVFLVVFAAFFFPAAALGTISPAVAKWALDRGYATGRTVGTIYFWNTLGSILGTFATGYFLISTFYVSRLIAGSSLVLALIALIFMAAAGSWMMRLTSLAWTIGVAAVAVFAAIPASRFESAVLAVFPVQPEPNETRAEFEQRERARLRLAASLLSRDDEINIWDQYNFRDDFEDYDESNYYTIQIGEETKTSNKRDDYELDEDGKPRELDGEKVIRQRSLRKLVLDALVHGYMDMNDFKYLHYEYEHLYATVSHRLLREHEKEGQPLRVLFLGGGSYTFPRYLSEFYKDIRCEVAEIDPRVTKAVMRSMGLNQARGKEFFVLGPKLPDGKEASPSQSKDKSAKGGGGQPAAADPAKATWRDKLAAVVDAFRTTPTDAERASYYAKRIRQAGGIVRDEVATGVDYVLDVRPNPGTDDAALAEAKKLGIPVIDPAKFQEMLETTSHDNIITYHMDARQFIMQNQDAGKYDIIYGDAFNDFSVPAHLTTVEFNREMARLLKPDGVFMANVIDIWSKSRFMGAYLNTLEQVFKHVYLLSTDEGKPDHKRATFVLICSQEPLDLKDLGSREDEQGLVSTLLEGELLKPVIRGGLFPLGRTTLVADGKTTEFTLPRSAHAAGVVNLNARSSRNVDAEVREGNVLRFKALDLPRPGAEVKVALFDDDDKRIGEIVLPIRHGQLEYQLDKPCDRVEVTVTAVEREPVDDSEYELVGDRTLKFKEPPAEGARLLVTMYSDHPIILTDKYCPVDNLCGEVAATRAAD